MIDARSVTTEINTLFQTITSIAEKVDPVKLNLTLSAAAQSLAGLGDRFGQSIVNANAVLDDVNPQMPQARHDIRQLAGLGDTYANASPDLFDFLNNAVTTSRTLNQQQRTWTGRCCRRPGSATPARTFSAAAGRTWRAERRTWCRRPSC